MSALNTLRTLAKLHQLLDSLNPTKNAEPLSNVPEQLAELVPDELKNISISSVLLLAEILKISAVLPSHPQYKKVMNSFADKTFPELTKLKSATNLPEIKGSGELLVCMLLIHAENTHKTYLSIIQNRTKHMSSSSDQVYGAN